MSIGYECQSTPLQMLTFYNAVANNGRMMKPYLVDAITNEGHVVKRFRPQVAKDRIASDKTIAKARELLEGVVLRGTAKRMQSPYVTYAGKTGTARIDYYLPDDGRKNYQSSFAGYFPADKPQYSCIVVINDPKGGKYYGSAVALPVFVEIAEQCMALVPM
jgi:cell division protein FtsI (penicillin-binding protein 3)